MAMIEEEMFPPRRKAPPFSKPEGSTTRKDGRKRRRDPLLPQVPCAIGQVSVYREQRGGQKFQSPTVTRNRGRLLTKSLRN